MQSNVPVPSPFTIFSTVIGVGLNDGDVVGLDVMTLAPQTNLRIAWLVIPISLPSNKWRAFPQRSHACTHTVARAGQHGQRSACMLRYLLNAVWTKDDLVAGWIDRRLPHFYRTAWSKVTYPASRLNSNITSHRYICMCSLWAAVATMMPVTQMIENHSSLRPSLLRLSLSSFSRDGAMLAPAAAAAITTT